MPFDENGNYNRLHGPTGWQDDRDANIKILASRHDDDGNDTAAALNQTFLADGRKTAAGHFKMGGYRVSAMGDAQERQDASAAKQVQAFAFNYGQDVSQEANAVKVNLSPAPQSLPGAMLVFVKVAHNNTGKTTLQLNALAAKPVYLGDQEIGEGMLRAGQTYIFFYSQAQDAFQLIPSGSMIGQAVPPFTMVFLDHLLTGEAAVGWELQGARCYKSKYWEQYQQLADEYAQAVSRTETVEGEEFAYKVNLTTMRRFYSKTNYDARFALCGDSGGYVLDEETYSFYLPKSNNYMRPAVTADNLAAYQKDTMRPVKFSVSDYPNAGGEGRYPAVTGCAEVVSQGVWNGGLEDWAGRGVLKVDSSKQGEHFAGEETAPKSRFVAVYYKLGPAYTQQISQAVVAAENYAKQAQAAVGGIDADVAAAQAAAAASAQSAQKSREYSSGALGLLTNQGVVKFWRGTLAQYQAVAEKDPDTLYLVEE